MACVGRPRLHGSHGNNSGRHDAMARMRERKEKGHTSSNDGAGDCAPRRARADRNAGMDEPKMMPLPTPRGGARGPAEARLAREVPSIGTTEEPLPAAAKGADFKTLQALIAKGIQANEEDGVLLEASLGGAEWSSRDQAEEAEWKEAQLKKRLAEEAAREKEKERAREQRRRQDEERRRKQMEELERELEFEKQHEAELAAETQRRIDSCRREFHAAAAIQAHHRGRRSRAGRPIDVPSKSASWALHLEEYMRRPAY